MKLTLFLTFAFLFQTVWSYETVPHYNYTSLAEALHGLESYILKFNETGRIPGLAFGLSVKGKPVFEKAWGLADLSNYSPVKLSTHFRLASISKTFTSALLGQLVDQGLVHYDDLIGKYVDQQHFGVKKWDGSEVNITIRQLLSHSAGLYATNMAKDMFGTLDPADNVTQMLAHFRDQPLHHKPGTVFEYANNGFQLIGGVIEAVTKKPFQQVVQEFAKKNNLPNTLAGNPSVVLHEEPRYYSGFEPKIVMHENDMSKLDLNSTKNYPTTPFDEMILANGWWPAGGLVSTVADLLHYGQLMIDAYKGRHGAILSQKTVKQMWTPQISAALPPNVPVLYSSDYGYGWFVAKPNPDLKHQHLVWHSGGLLGLSSMLIIYPDEEIVGVAFSNKGAVVEQDKMIVFAAENVCHLVK